MERPGPGFRWGRMSPTVAGARSRLEAFKNHQKWTLNAWIRDELSFLCTPLWAGPGGKNRPTRIPDWEGGKIHKIIRGIVDRRSARLCGHIWPSPSSDNPRCEPWSAQCLGEVPYCWPILYLHSTAFRHQRYLDYWNKNPDIGWLPHLMTLESCSFGWLSECPLRDSPPAVDVGGKTDERAKLSCLFSECANSKYFINFVKSSIWTFSNPQVNGT